MDGRPGELLICHGIISSLGGTITARNEGGGAVFAPALPEAPAA